MISIREAVVVVVVVLAASAAHFFSRVSLISLVPFFFLTPLLCTWGLPRRAYYLSILVVAGELLSATPPGILTAAILLPLMIDKVRNSTEPDISFSFIGTLFGITILQNFIVHSSAWIQQQPVMWGKLLTFVPWNHVIFSSIVLTTLSMLGILLLRALLPPMDTRVVSLSGAPLRSLKS